MGTKNIYQNTNYIPPATYSTIPKASEQEPHH